MFPLVYDELRRIAARAMRGERPDHTLCTTALVHEAWLELSKLTRIQWQNRSHFLAIAAQAMRRVLIDYAVARRRQKRGGGQTVESLDEDAVAVVVEQADDMLALDEALAAPDGHERAARANRRVPFLRRDERRRDRRGARHLTGNGQAGLGPRPRLVESGASGVTDHARLVRRTTCTGPQRCRPSVGSVFSRSSRPRSTATDGTLNAVLDRECGDDVELRREVESLLEAHNRPGLVDRLVGDLAPAISQARSSMLGWEGQSVGRYRMLEALGSGAMGVVYKALDERLGRHVALKFLPPHLGARPEAKRRFLLEARAAAALDHPNICTIHEIGETSEGQLFIAMPLYHGETLQARLVRGPLPCEDAVAVALQIASGLQQAHEHGIVHRDVKPSNVMLLSDGTAKVLDFGVAKVEDVTITDGDVVLGTVAYMSPEQALGRPVDHRADVWSLGVVLYEMLTGTRPFHGNSRQALIDAILARDPEPISAWRADLPAAVDDVVRRALAKLQDDRYASMSSMAADLAALAEPSRSSRPLGRIAGHRAGRRAPTRPRRSPPARSADGRRWSCTTVSDYSALVERLSPGELETLLGDLRRAAAEVVQRHGGIVNQAIGDEIVSLFGVPIAHEDDDLRAVRAAIELRQRTREVGASVEHALGTPVRVQCGVHVGLLVAQRLTDDARRYALSGAPAQVAARLASLADADQVLVSPECHRLVAPFVDSQPCAPLTIQANGGTVSPFRILGESGLQTRLEAAERADLTPYTGSRCRTGDAAGTGSAGARRTRTGHDRGRRSRRRQEPAAV